MWSFLFVREYMELSSTAKERRLVYLSLFYGICMTCLFYFLAVMGNHWSRECL
jgi:hypothetical protein